jgi:hypothetical protein
LKSWRLWNSSKIADVKPMTEIMPLELAAEAYSRMMSAKARFRIVLVTGAFEESVAGERHLPAKHYRWREKRNEDFRGCRFGCLASVSTHFAEKVSRQSGRCLAASLLDSVLTARAGCRWIFAEDLN